MIELLIIAAIVLVPFLELRASIPYGILVLDQNWLIVFIVSVVANIILGILLFPMIDHIFRFFRKFAWLDKLCTLYMDRTQKKIDKLVKKYGFLGIAVFIGIPLPGSGVYSGSVAAYLIGLSFKRFIIANIIGVLIAGIAVTIIVLSGYEASLFIRRI